MADNPYANRIFTPSEPLSFRCSSPSPSQPARANSPISISSTSAASESALFGEELRINQFASCTLPLSPATLTGDNSASAADFLLALAFERLLDDEDNTAETRHFLNRIRGDRPEDANMESLLKLERRLNQILKRGFPAMIRTCPHIARDLRAAQALLNKRQWVDGGEVRYPREKLIRELLPWVVRDVVIVVVGKNGEEMICSCPGSGGRDGVGFDLENDGARGGKGGQDGAGVPPWVLEASMKADELDRQLAELEEERGKDGGGSGSKGHGEGDEMQSQPHDE